MKLKIEQIVILVLALLLIISFINNLSMLLDGADPSTDLNISSFSPGEGQAPSQDTVPTDYRQTNADESNSSPPCLPSLSLTPVFIDWQTMAYMFQTPDGKFHQVVFVDTTTTVLKPMLLEDLIK